jgi:hypothetical protein
LVEKKVPHLGHLSRLSFDMDAHPKEKQMTIDIMMNIFIFASIINPSIEAAVFTWNDQSVITTLIGKYKEGQKSRR